MTELLQKEYYIGQIFEGEYPPQAAEWCNEQANCHIEEITVDNTLRRFQIKKNEEMSVVEKEYQFNKDFFNTSLGYIRRKVTMKNGEIKDFLTDLLPSIAIGIQINQPANIICYNFPDFTQNEINFEELQHVETATSQFVQECFLQLNNDFNTIEV